ncbi:MAG: UvrB/UvrC motif-containing protein [Chlamydiota bacterium]
MADRPVECSHCKKSIKTNYKEIVGRQVICTGMCADCPVLERRLHGELPHYDQQTKTLENETSLYCSNCHTSLDAVKMGDPLGCSECYSVFGDLLAQELTTQGKIPSRLQKTFRGKKTTSIHAGKSPTQEMSIPGTARLATLNEALGDALKQENYEQAAWLRDQIKALKEKPGEGKN